MYWDRVREESDTYVRRVDGDLLVYWGKGKRDAGSFPGKT